MPLIFQQKTIGLNDSGIDKAEEFFNLDNLYDIENVAFDSLYRQRPSCQLHHVA